MHQTLPNLTKILLSLIILSANINKTLTENSINTNKTLTENTINTNNTLAKLATAIESLVKKVDEDKNVESLAEKEVEETRKDDNNK